MLLATPTGAQVPLGQVAEIFPRMGPPSIKTEGAQPQAWIYVDIDADQDVGTYVERAKQVVAAVREGWAAYLADPKSTNQFMHNLNNAMDESTYQQAAEAQKPLIETDFTRANGLGAMTADRWSALAQQLVDLKVLKQMPKIDDCFVSKELARVENLLLGFATDALAYLNLCFE